MLRRMFASTLAFVLIVSVLVMTVTAAPFKEIKVGEGETVIEAVWFDGGFENYESDGSGNKDIRPDEEVATYDYTINDDYAGGRETDTPSCIGWIAAGEWVQYTIQVEVAGKYQVEVWGAAGGGGDFDAFYNGNKIGSAYIEDFGGWHDYVKYPVGTVDMTVGTHVIRTEYPDGGINVESMIFTLLEAAAAPEPPPAVVDLPEAIGGGDENLHPAPVVAAPVPAPAPTPVAVPQTGVSAALAVLGALSAAVTFGAVRSRKGR